MAKLTVDKLPVDPPSFIPPDPFDVRDNALKEPEGERIRNELIEFLERNEVVSILLDTPHHHVNIQWGPLLPSRIKTVLTVWGSIFVEADPE